MVVTYSSYPKVTLTWSSTSNLSYVIVSWTGNTTATSGSYSSGNVYLPTTSYTTGDLSFNTKYSFALTPYNSSQTSGTANVMYIDTTPATSGIYATYSTSSTAQLQWYGSYDYVKVHRQHYKYVSGTLTATGFGDLSSVAIANPYTDYDLSGNTTYVYYIRPYISGVSQGDSAQISVSTNVQAPKDVSVNFYDSSAIKLSFTTPKNTYSSNVYYTAVGVDNSSNTVTTVGSASPLWLTNLSGGTQYTCYVRVTLDYSSNLVGTSSTLTQTTKSGSYVNISFYGGNTYVVGTNRIFVFNKNPVNMYSSTSNASSPNGVLSIDTNSGSITATILAVGGGGGGGGSAPGMPTGGGGAGGLIYTTRTISTTNTIYATVGSGGGSTSNGSSSYVYFSNGIAGGSLDASGGGCGNWADFASSGGSGGGTSAVATAKSGISGLGNAGGIGESTGSAAGGGGGAGGAGSNGTYTSSTTTAYGGNGGDGLAYSITGSTVYYAAGGGGAANATNNVAGKGGNGGGGDGVIGYFSGNGNNATGYGCGGGGAVQSYSGGSGSNGIIVISIPTSSISTLYYYVDDMSGLTFYYNFNTSITYETISATTSGTTTGTVAQSSVIPFTTTGYSASFTGSNAYITLSNSITLSSVGFSICNWFKIPSSTLSAGFNLIQIGGSTYYFKLCVYSGNSNYLGFYSKSSSTVMTNIYYPTTVFDNTWHHSAIIMKNSGTISWYIDGSLISYTNVVTNTYPSITSYNTQYIGDNNSVSNSGTYYLDDVRYYNGPITSNTVTELYNQKSSTSQLTSYSATTYDASAITLSWSGSNVSKVFVYDLVSNKMSGSYSGSSVTLNGLVTNLRYYFVVSPFDSNGVQGQSVIVDASTNVAPAIWYKFDSGDVANTLVYNYANNTYDSSMNNAYIDTSTYHSGTGSVYINNATTNSYSQWVTLTSKSLKLTLGNGFTVMAWVKWDTSKTTLGSGASSGQNMGVFNVNDTAFSSGSGTGIYQEGTGLGLTQGGVQLDQQFGLNGNGETKTSYGSNMMNGSWHFTCWRINTNGTWDYFYDGTWYYSVGGSYVYTPLTYTSFYLAIGGGGNSAMWWCGWIDNFRIYNTALNSFQINSIYTTT